MNPLPVCYRRIKHTRRGTVAVEAAVILPLVITLMVGLWEVGRLAQVNQLLNNACREGARVAAGGYQNGTPVTVAVVQQTVRDYMTAAGIPSTAVSNAQITLTNLSSHSWTDPVDAQPLDSFKVKIKIPSGAAFNSLKWVLLNQTTGISEMNVECTWDSANNSKVVVSPTLPY